MLTDLNLTLQLCFNVRNEVEISCEGITTQKPLFLELI